MFDIVQVIKKFMTNKDDNIYKSEARHTKPSDSFALNDKFWRNPVFCLLNIHLPSPFFLKTGLLFFLLVFNAYFKVRLT